MASPVKVAVRARPLSGREARLHPHVTVEMTPRSVRLFDPKGRQSGSGLGTVVQDSKEFSYDFCYWSVDKESPNFASQEKVYDDLGPAILEGAFSGYNSCVLAYGQTGAGKTYTMMGSPDDPGVTPRLCQALFEQIEQVQSPDVSYRTLVSFAEIYNEHVGDLLHPSAQNKVQHNLKVREHPTLGPYVPDLTQHPVSTSSQMLDFLKRGNGARATASTQMNESSSRSHAVFTITFRKACFAGDSPSETTSTISLVDLAGSERQKDTKATGSRLKEGTQINKSLVALGNVISALAEQSKSKSRRRTGNHIPYRDSVLTWLLRDSLGGNSLTLMIAAVSPSSQCYAETLSTLRYASRAKEIVNRPVVNEDSNVKLIRELRMEVSRLKSVLTAMQVDLAEGMGTNAIAEHLKNLEKNETLANHLTKEWTGQWHEFDAQDAAAPGPPSAASSGRNSSFASVSSISFQQDVAVKEDGVAVALDSELPHLVSIDGDITSTGIRLYYLLEGNTRLSSCPSDDPDVRLCVSGDEQLECQISNMDDVLNLHIVEGDCSVNGAPVTGSTRLQQGQIILIGRHNIFRFNHPAEAVALKERKEAGGSTLSRRSSFDLASMLSPGKKPVPPPVKRAETAMNFSTMPSLPAGDRDGSPSVKTPPHSLKSRRARITLMPTITGDGSSDLLESPACSRNRTISELSFEAAELLAEYDSMPVPVMGEAKQLAELLLSTSAKQNELLGQLEYSLSSQQSATPSPGSTPCVLGDDNEENTGGTHTVSCGSQGDSHGQESLSEPPADTNDSLLAEDIGDAVASTPSGTEERQQVDDSTMAALCDENPSKPILGNAHTVEHATAAGSSMQPISDDHATDIRTFATVGTDFSAVTEDMAALHVEGDAQSGSESCHTSIGTGMTSSSENYVTVSECSASTLASGTGSVHSQNQSALASSATTDSQCTHSAEADTTGDLQARGACAIDDVMVGCGAREYRSSTGYSTGESPSNIGESSLHAGDRTDNGIWTGMFIGMEQQQQQQHQQDSRLQLLRSQEDSELSAGAARHSNASVSTLVPLASWQAERDRLMSILQASEEAHRQLSQEVNDAELTLSLNTASHGEGGGPSSFVDHAAACSSVDHREVSDGDSYQFDSTSMSSGQPLQDDVSLSGQSMYLFECIRNTRNKHLQEMDGWTSATGASSVSPNQLQALIQLQMKQQEELRQIVRAEHQASGELSSSADSTWSSLEQSMQQQCGQLTSLLSQLQTQHQPVDDTGNTATPVQKRTEGPVRSSEPSHSAPSSTVHTGQWDASRAALTRAESNQRAAACPPLTHAESFDTASMVTMSTVQTVEQCIAALPSCVTVPSAQLRATDNSPGHHVFRIQVSVGSFYWSVERRYREFLAQHLILIRCLPELSTLKLPPTKWFGNKKSVFVEERRKRLEFYLQMLLLRLVRLKYFPWHESPTQQDLVLRICKDIPLLDEKSMIPTSAAMPHPSHGRGHTRQATPSDVS